MCEKNQLARIATAEFQAGLSSFLFPYNINILFVAEFTSKVMKIKMLDYFLNLNNFEAKDMVYTVLGCPALTLLLVYVLHCPAMSHALQNL